MNKNLVLSSVFILLVIILVILFFLKNKISILDQENTGRSQFIFAKVNDINLTLEVADTFIKRAKGLSGREGISDDQGMLFVFKKPDLHSFWMKGMKFSIDIVWIDENLKIVEISKNVSPESFAKTFRPTKSVQYVLEIKAGWVDEHSIKEGDGLSFINKVH